MCTTVIVGEKASYDGSFLMARSADSSALKAQHFVIHPAKEYPEGAMYRTRTTMAPQTFLIRCQDRQCATQRFLTGKQDCTVQ